MRRTLANTRRFGLALAVLGVFVATVVAGASAADFDVDGGPCRETPGEALLLRCPTAYVGQEYEIEIESEEGSGCSPNYDYFVIVNSALPPGLTMSRDGVISGTPTSAGFTRFWVFNHDLPGDQGGPAWCIRDDTSEREFSIFVDPGLEIENESLPGATIGQAYAQTLTAQQLVNLDPPSGNAVQAEWSLISGSLPPGLALSAQGTLAGTPTSEGSWEFVVKAQNGSPFDTKTFGLSVRQPVVVSSPFAAGAAPRAEVGIRFGATATATGGSGTYTWSLASGALPAGLALDAAKGTIAGRPLSAGSFAFALTAKDADGRVATANAALTVAPRLAVKTARLKAASLARRYRATVATTGGVRPVKWKLVRGKLPLGVRFSPTRGTFAGTPRQAGTFHVRVEARDALGAKARKSLVLSVRG